MQCNGTVRFLGRLPCFQHHFYGIQFLFFFFRSLPLCLTLRKNALSYTYLCTVSWTLILAQCTRTLFLAVVTIETTTIRHNCPAIRERDPLQANYARRNICRNWWSSVYHRGHDVWDLRFILPACSVLNFFWLWFQICESMWDISNFIIICTFYIILIRSASKGPRLAKQSFLHFVDFEILWVWIKVYVSVKPWLEYSVWACLWSVVPELL